ncbi:MAG: EI24 domain-containing protein [Alphaproteobacteria bacterium]|nr:EI24 domain-containing protein [Alphaproteobacteria bacterium]
MFSELKSAIKDVFSNKIRGLLFRSVLLTLAVFVVLFFGFSYAMSFVELTDWPKVQKMVKALGYIMFFILSLVLFPSIVTFVSGFFIDSVVDRMSAENDIHRLRNVPLSESLAVSGVVVFKGIALSTLLIPITALLGWIPFVNFLPVVLYYGLNGRLLAREYFFAVALRYMEKQKAEDLFNRYHVYWVKAGVIIAVLMTIPVANAIAPLVAMAFMQRLFLIRNPDRETV